MQSTSSPETIKIASILKSPTIDGYSSPQLQPSTANTLNSLSSLPKSLRSSFKARSSNTRLIPFQSNKSPIRSIPKTPSLADLMEQSHSPTSHSRGSKEPLSFAEISPSLFSPPSFDFDQKQQKEPYSRSDSLLKLYSCSQEANLREERKTPMRPSKLLEQLQSVHVKLQRTFSAEKEEKEKKVQEENKKEVSFSSGIEKITTPKLRIDYKTLSIQLISGNQKKNIHKMSMLDKMKKKVLKSCGETELKIFTSQNSNILEMAPSLTPLDNQQFTKSTNVLNKVNFRNSPQHIRTKSEINPYNEIHPHSLSFASTPNKMTIKNFLTPKKESIKLDFSKEEKIHTEALENHQLADLKSQFSISRKKLTSPHTRSSSLTKLHTNKVYF